jgi:hypothetical protein
MTRKQLVESIALAMVHQREPHYRWLTTWDEVAFEIGPYAATLWLVSAGIAVSMVLEAITTEGHPPHEAEGTPPWLAS